VVIGVGVGVGVGVAVIVHGVVEVKTLVNPNLPTGKPPGLNLVGIHQVVQAAAVTVVEGVAEAMGRAIHNLNRERVNESISFCHSIYPASLDGRSLFGHPVRAWHL